MLCLREELYAAIGQGGTASGTMKQGKAEFRFQCFDLLAERRLLDVQGFGCTSKTPVIRNGNEVT